MYQTCKNSWCTIPSSLFVLFIKMKLKKKKIFNLINSILFMLKIRNRGHTCELLISKIYFTKRNETSATERLALVFQLHRHFAKWVWNMSEILTYTLIQFILYKSFGTVIVYFSDLDKKEAQLCLFHCSAWDTITTTDVTAKTL